MTEKLILNFVIYRTIVATSLFLAALIIQYINFFALPLDFLFYLTAFIYFLNIFYLILKKSISVKTNLYIQLSFDIVIESAIVYLTGSLTGSFTFLYLITILVASLFLYRKGGLIFAAFSSIAYGLLVDLQFYRILPSFFYQPLLPIGRIYYNLITNFLGFFIVALLGSFISERLKKTREELSSTEEQYQDLVSLNQAIVSSVTSYLFALDKLGKIIFQNKESIKRFGFLKRFEDLKVFSEDFKDLIQKLEKERVVIEKKIDLGESFFEGRISALYNINNEMEGVLVVLDDITSKVKLEEELKKRDKMATIGSLSQAIAHEIRNPLASISGSVQMLREGEMDPRRKTLVNIIAQETFRLSRIIENFLLFARPKPITKYKYSLTQQIKDFYLLLLNSPEKDPHEVALEIPDREIFIKGDRDMIQQVLWNLVRNSFKAMGSKKGKLTIRLKNEGYAKIEVEDTGPGIPEEKKELIFEPFSSNFQDGLGVGLALCKRIISEHRGKILVKSREKEKTIFEVILPYD